MDKTIGAEVTRWGALDMQVCVPADWTDDQIVAFANAENICGTTNGWQIRRAGHRLLEGAPERVTCSDRSGNCHIMLDA